jgi:hypothetical protein
VKERKHARPGVRIILLAALLLAFGGLSLLVIVDKSRLRGLEDSIAAMKEESVPLRFQVTARSGGGIETKLKFYDADGKEIAVAERAMKGESLFLDFVSVPVGGRFLSFPKAAFTEAIPAEKGLDLLGYYDSGGFPMVFAAEGMDRRSHDGLAALFLKLKLGNEPGGSFGNAVHDVKQFKSFDIGTVYKVVTRMKGGIEIMEDDE